MHVLRMGHRRKKKKNIQDIIYRCDQVAVPKWVLAEATPPFLQGLKKQEEEFFFYTWKSRDQDPKKPFRKVLCAHTETERVYLGAAREAAHRVDLEAPYLGGRGRNIQGSRRA